MKVITVGKKHDSWVVDGIMRYEKRLRQPFDLDWVIIPHSSRSGNEARRDESRVILNKITNSDYVILLDETGENIDSPTLARKINNIITTNQIVCIIGGAYGVDERVKKRANLIWSLSNLVFPHMLVRLILTEQIYRAQEINRGSSYHHM